MIDIPIAKIWKEHEIVWLEVKKTEQHNIDDAHQIVAAHNELADGTPWGVVWDMTRADIGADREAGDYWAATDGRTDFLRNAERAKRPPQTLGFESVVNRSAHWHGVPWLLGAWTIAVGRQPCLGLVLATDQLCGERPLTHRF